MVRSVSSTVGSSRITIGTSTAAWAGTRSVMRGSRRSSGAQVGGFAKRARKACASRCAAATAGNPASTLTTGTFRGSNDGSTLGATALMTSAGVAVMVDEGWVNNGFTG